MVSKIVKNEAECVRCGHILKSLHVHDFRTHSCHPSIWFMVDGGLAYIRRGWGVAGVSSDPVKHYIERSIEAVPVGFHVWQEQPVSWAQVGAA